jgi:hypothetical protein
MLKNQAADNKIETLHTLLLRQRDLHTQICDALTDRLAVVVDHDRIAAVIAHRRDRPEGLGGRLRDAADALFGKRTDIRDAHDKYANQEVAYLLQRVENYNGLVILASNQRSNIDNAFSRRFQNIIPFPMPRPEERLSIWKKTIPQQLPLDMDLDIENIALRYELSGAAILNIIQYCSIQLLADTAPFLTAEMLDAAVRREYIKEGRIT